MKTIAQVLAEADRLPGETPALDMQLLLCEVLGCEQSYLRAWPEKALSQEQSQALSDMLEQRQGGIPVAHLLGHQAFWTLDLKVSPATLIPRQDTELLVELALSEKVSAHLPARAKVLDLGTGTGAIALALASERPAWQVQGVDFDEEIVGLAAENARRNGLERVRFSRSNWFSSLPAQHFDLIVSNPPYIDPQDEHLDEGDLRFEARSALVADKQGLADIELIVDQARQFLAPAGTLMLEHGYDQGEAVRKLMLQAGFEAVQTCRDLGNNERVTYGRLMKGGESK